MTKGTKNCLLLPSKVPKLNIKIDGTIYGSNIPDCMFLDDVVSTGHTRTVHGSWEIEEFDGDWLVVPNIVAPMLMPNRKVEEKKGYHMNWYIFGAKPPYQLRISLGEPSHHAYLVFDKSGAAKESK